MSLIFVLGKGTSNFCITEHIAEGRYCVPFFCHLHTVYCRRLLVHSLGIETLTQADQAKSQFATTSRLLSIQECLRPKF